MSNGPPTIIFAGGGTLGHLFAGLAAADAMRGLAPATSIHFAGSGSPGERKQVEGAGYSYHQVACRPWPRRPWTAGGFLFSNLRGYLRGRCLLHQLHADAVVGLGGYASAPIARAAVSLAVPLILLEQNAVPGRANRWLSRYAACVCVAFDADSTRRLRNVHFAGNPVRPGFFAPCVADPSEKLLVITGGSHGAAALNAALPAALAKCKPLLTGWRIVHQAGKREVAVTQQRYDRAGIAAEVTAFADLAGLLPRASLAVCRAGGSTIAELCVTGTPAILCPYPHASDDHQRHNAAAVADGCRVVDERLPDFIGRITQELSLLLANAELRTQMALAISRHSRPNAARHIAQRVLATAERAQTARVGARRVSKGNPL